MVFLLSDRASITCIRWTRSSRPSARPHRKIFPRFTTLQRANILNHLDLNHLLTGSEHFQPSATHGVRTAPGFSHWPSCLTALSYLPSHVKLNVLIFLSIRLAFENAPIQPNEADFIRRCHCAPLLERFARARRRGNRFNVSSTNCATWKLILALASCAGDLQFWLRGLSAQRRSVSR